jgi:hypothetical protein
MAKFVYVALLGILCINMSIFLVNEYDILSEVTYMTPVLPGDVSSNVDINGTITPEPSLTNVYGYDIWGNLNKLWRLVGTLVAGLPILMNELGAPLPIILIVDAIYIFMWGVFFIEMGIGRDIGE